jgi:hypothetical protein
VVVDNYVFSDESGIHGEDAAYCVVSGYMGSRRQWKLFEREWASILRKEHVPNFHSKEFFQPEKRKRKPYYRNWSESRAEHFLKHLLDAIWARTIKPVGAAINVADFYARSEEERRVLTGGHPRVLSDDDQVKHKGMTTGSKEPYRLAAILLGRVPELL